MPARSVVSVTFEGSAAAPLELPSRPLVGFGCVLPLGAGPALLVYAYCVGVFWWRKVERAT